MVVQLVFAAVVLCLVYFVLLYLGARLLAHFKLLPMEWFQKDEVVKYQIVAAPDLEFPNTNFAWPIGVTEEVVGSANVSFYCVPRNVFARDASQLSTITTRASADARATVL